ncbi:MAG: iron-containing alcohol dehydrogenase [Elusimicrobiota bacterium]
MLDFIFRNPTEILFGKGMIAKLDARVPKGAKTLLLYGGGSIKRNGVYEQVRSALGKRLVVEFGGIEPNPLYETCMKAVERVRQEDVRFILAVGGGSALDAAKFIAAAAVYKGTDPWDILRSCGSKVESALPLGTVLTLPATGSESNMGAVISRAATREKLPFMSRHVFPQFSVLDPQATFSLPARQVRNGIVDTFVHVTEQYVTYPAAAPLQDRLAESILQTLLEVGPKTLEKPDDYDARASLMWCATLGLNTLIGCGVPQDWATHMIGHELTAFYGLDHAQSLAVVLPGLWRRTLESKRAKLEQYGRRVFGVADAETAIQRTEDFFRSIGVATRLKDYGVDAQEAAGKLRSRFVERGMKVGENGDIDAGAVAEIIKERA